ncbi:MAG: helix-turn-helix transcriptional regulator [Bacteroidetes bacterium]|nr:helix-turn-helix transcriptional regulator [Bacteroidota bacterium]
MPVVRQSRYLLGNMLSDCCLRLLSLELERLGVEIRKARLGEVHLRWDEEKVAEADILQLFDKLGFGVIEDHEKALVEEIKRVVVELVWHTTFNAMVRNSDFIVSRFDHSYQYLSTLFSRHEHITLEKYIIMQKIEKVKELLQDEKITLSEIAYMMGYSSVQYLSTQFRQITGYSVTEYRSLPEKNRMGIRLSEAKLLDKNENFEPQT